MTTTVQRQNVNEGLVQATAPNFVPKSGWPELEAARQAHERALEEHAGVQARRREAREEERQLQEHLKSVQAGKEETKREADRAVKHALSEALGEHGAAWVEEVASARAAALEERDELLARVAELEAKAHSNDAVEAWILQATSKSVPRQFGRRRTAVAPHVPADPGPAG